MAEHTIIGPNENAKDSGKRLISTMKVSTTGRVFTDTALQDQTSPTLIAKFNNITNSTTLQSEALIDTYDLDLTSVVGVIIGSYIIAFSDAINRYYIGIVVSIAGNVLTMDTPLDATFPIGTTVDITVTNMAVDGSVTPVVFAIRGDSPSDIPLTVDITRIIFKCFADTTVNLSLFGDLPKLTRGLLARAVYDEATTNIFNVKDNGEIAGVMYDWSPYSKDKPNEGQDGFTARLTFASQGKIGVVIRIGPDEDFEIWIQDDLTDLDTLEITAEGHVVD